MMDSPSRRICPSDGLYTPLMQLNTEVLPAPLGPMIASRDRGATLEADVGEHAETAEGERDVLDLEDRAHACRPRVAAQVQRLDLLVVAELVGGSRQGHRAVLEHVGVVGDRQRHRRVLLDQEHGRAAGVDLDDHVSNPLDDQRGQSEGRFVEKEEVGLGHQRSADRQHLLFAAGEVAGLRTAPFA